MKSASLQLPSTTNALYMDQKELNNITHRMEPEGHMSRLKPFSPKLVRKKADSVSFSASPINSPTNSLDRSHNKSKANINTTIKSPENDSALQIPLGFNVSAPRKTTFAPQASRLLNEIVGPGRYDLIQNDYASDSVAFNKKGYGAGFISGTKRFQGELIFFNKGPGPGSYDLMRDMVKRSPPNKAKIIHARKYIKTDEGAINFSNKPKLQPLNAPFDLDRFKRKSIPSLGSVFQSESIRTPLVKEEISPGPGSYNIRLPITSAMSSTKNRNTSSFSLPIGRKITIDLNSVYELDNVQRSKLDEEYLQQNETLGAKRARSYSRMMFNPYQVRTRFVPNSP